MISDEKKILMAELVLEQNARLLEKLDKAKALEKELLAALKKAMQDVNWMLNSRQFLNEHVFNEYWDLIAKAEAQEAGDE